MDKLCADIFTSNAHQIMSLTSHLLGKIGLYSAAKRVLWFFSFFFFYGDPVQCLVKTLSQSQFIASESYHDKFAKIKAVRKAISSYLHHFNSSDKRSSDIFSVFLLMRSNHNANTNIL